MITTPQQYVVTKRRAEEFRQALADLAHAPTEVHPALRDAQEQGLKSLLSEMDADIFEYDQTVAGLSGDWYILDDNFYTLTTAWWQSFDVVLRDDKWIVKQWDHDASLSENGELGSAYDEWSERYSTWTDAAKAVEERYLAKH